MFYHTSCKISLRLVALFADSIGVLQRLKSEAVAAEDYTTAEVLKRQLIELARAPLVVQPAGSAG